jgi:hypothetical protein
VAGQDGGVCCFAEVGVDVCEIQVCELESCEQKSCEA